MLRRIEIGLHHTDHDLASGVARATGPVLLAIDDPLVTLEHGVRADIGGVR